MAAATTPITHPVEFKNIVILSDLGSEAEKPLRFAAALAQQHGAKLTVAHACQSGPYMYIPPESHAAGRNMNLSPQQAEEEIHAMVSAIPLPHSMVSTVVRSATVKELLEQLLQQHPDLLVLATHAKTGIGKWLSGSVTENIFRRAKCPVMVLPPALADPETAGKQFQRILFTTDLSDGAANALHYAMQISERSGGHAVALHVHPDANCFYFERLMAMQQLEAWLHRQGLSHQQMGTIECIVRFGKSSEEIKAAATLYQSELIILGARGFGALSGVASHFVGGTAYDVACSAECPVLIVPETGWKRSWQ